MIALQLRFKRQTLFPQKEFIVCFYKTRERMPPPKPPLAAVSEPDPIYPYLPFLFCLPIGNDRAI
jgi:hypothetical protein